MKKYQRFTVIKGRARKPKKIKKVVFYLFLFLSILIVTRAVYSYTQNLLAARLVRTVIADTGILEHSLKTQGFLVRNERLASAPITGTLTWIAADGEKVAAGKPVAELSAGEVKETVVAHVSGILVLQLDGLEGALQPRGLSEIDPAKVSKTTAKIKQFREGELVQQGSVIFKIIENFNWFYLTEIAVDDYLPLQQSTSCELRFSFATDQTAIGKVVREDEKNDRVILAFEFNDHLQGCFNERFIEAQIITQKVRGILLSASVLVEHEEQTGVYILLKSVVRFRPVEVLGEKGDQVVIEGLSPGAQVITNPSLVKEGQRL